MKGVKSLITASAVLLLATAFPGNRLFAAPKAVGSGYEIAQNDDDNGCAVLMAEADNILRGKTPTYIDSDHSWYNEGNFHETQTTDFGCVTDGKIPFHRNDWGYGWNDRSDCRALMPQDAKLEWTWETPELLANVRIFTQWPDGNRTDVSVTAIEVRVGESWTTLANSAFDFANATGLNTVNPYQPDLKNRMVTFADENPYMVLAVNVTGLRISFGNQTGNICYGCYWEIEAKRARFAAADATTGDLTTLTTFGDDAVRLIQVPELPNYNAYQIVRDNAEGSVAPDDDAWIPYDFSDPPSGTIDCERPAHAGDKAWLTFYLRDQALNTVAERWCFNTPNACLSHTLEPSDTFVDFSLEANVGDGATAVFRYGESRKTMIARPISLVGVSAGVVQGSLRVDGLREGQTYLWEAAVFENGVETGYAAGEFSMPRFERHGDGEAVNAIVYAVSEDQVAFQFTESGWVRFIRPVTADVLLVGGGGGGGTLLGGGGGGGGVNYVQSVRIPAGTYKVTVGEGGVGASFDGQVASANGGDSSFFDMIAYGGGAGGGSGFAANGYDGGRNSGLDGGCGGGMSGHRRSTAEDVVSGFGSFGFAGGMAIVDDGTHTDGGGSSKGAGAGGGGAGAAGGDAYVPEGADNVKGGAGGDGISCSISGKEVVYAGGGAGGSDYYGGEEVRALGGTGGGGAGGYLNSGNNKGMSGVDGVDGLGGGGGGAGKGFNYTLENTDGYGGGHGGSGVVIIRFRQRFSADSALGTGGDVVERLDGWMVHTFTNSGTFYLPHSCVGQVLLVGGGGGGGNGSGGGAGGGGGGGMLVVSNANIIAGTYDVKIGAGGLGGVNGREDGANGGDSVFSGWTAVGGGGGAGRWTQNGIVGGSGGGAYAHTAESLTEISGGAGVDGQGCAGGTNVRAQAAEGDRTNEFGAGGGGAGMAGAGATAAGGGLGGDGRVSDFSGKEVCYAGGGAGGTNGDRYSEPPEGSLGGGGRSGYWIWSQELNWHYEPATAGVDGLGGGGGGGAAFGNNYGPGGNGGSGIVIIRYRLRPARFVIIVR